MQRMEHCHDWAEKEQCDRSRESRVRTSELRRSRIENKNADFKRLFCGRHFCLPIDGHKHVGAILPAKPLPFVESRQHAPDFPGWPTSMLASTSRQSLCLPPGHANKLRLILVALTIDILAGTSEEPVSYGSLTKERFSIEIEKGMEDIKAGRVYSADEVEAEMKQEFGI